MATQLPRSERLAQADDVIDNAARIAALDAQVARLDAFYRELRARARLNRDAVPRTMARTPGSTSR